MQHKLGVHWIKQHGRPEDLEFIRRLQPPSIKIVASDVPDVQWISDTHKAAPEALIVLRSWAMSEQKGDMAADPVGTGKRHAAEWAGHVEKLRNEALRRRLPFPALEQIVVLGINEPVLDAPGTLPVDVRMAEMRQHAQRLDAYTVAFLDACRKAGLTAGALNLSVGWPTNWDLAGHPRPGSAPDWSLFEGTHAALIRNRGFLFIHEYHDLLGHSEMWRWWCGRYLQCPWPDVKIIIGECGLDRYVKEGDSIPGDKRGWRAWMNAEQHAAQLAAYHEEVLKDRRIHSIQPYTLDFSKPWDSFDLFDVSPHLLRYADEVRQRPATQPVTLYVTAKAGVNLRSGPGTEHGILHAIPYGDAVVFVAQAGDWAEVMHTLTGKQGFVFAQFLSADKPHNVYVPIVIGGAPTDERFQRAIAFVLRWEGGFSTDRNDKGNWTGGAVGVGIFKGTKYGISAAAHPDLDIQNLTVEQAKAIYCEKYWLGSGADKLISDMALIHMDTAVNMGVGRARQLLKDANEEPFTYLGMRLQLYTTFDDWQRYGSAWARRVADLMLEVDKA